MKTEINTVRDLRDFLTKLIQKSKCGDEKIRFFFNGTRCCGYEESKFLKMVSICRDVFIKETIIELVRE